MSEITLNSLGSGRGNLIVTFTDSLPVDTIEYVVFILDSSNNIIATDSFSLDDLDNDGKIYIGSTLQITWNHGSDNLTNGNTYSVQIGKNIDLQLKMYNINSPTQLTQKIYDLPNDPEVLIDHSGSQIILNWNKVNNNGSNVKQYNIYKASLNVSNLVLDGNWYLSKLDTSGTNITVPYDVTANDLYVKINGAYVKSPFGNLRCVVTTDYIIESTEIGNYIIVTPDGLVDSLGYQIQDISGNLYDADGDALLDFSGNMISIEADTDYIISADGNQVLADSSQNAIKYPNGLYTFDEETESFVMKKYSIYTKIENTAYVQAHKDGLRINAKTADMEPILNLLYIENNEEDCVGGLVSKLGILYDLDGNKVYDLSGNSVVAPNMSIKCDGSGQPILTSLATCLWDSSGQVYQGLIANYNSDNNRLGYQITKHQGDENFGYLVSAENDAGESPDHSGNIIMPFVGNCGGNAGQIVYSSADAATGFEVDVTLIDTSGMVLRWIVPASNGQYIGGYLLVVNDLNSNSAYGTIDLHAFQNDPKFVASLNKLPGTEVSLPVSFNPVFEENNKSLYGYFTDGDGTPKIGSITGSMITSTIAGIDYNNLKNYSFRLIAVNQNISAGRTWNDYINSRDISNFSNPAAIMPKSKPTELTSVTSVPGDSSVTLTIVDSKQNMHTNPILSYVITYVQNGSSVIDSSATTTTTIMGLTNGVQYTFTVMARNAKGLGPSMQCNTNTTPSGLPSAPVLTLYGHGATNIDLSWTEPVDLGGSIITGYEVYRSSDQTTWTNIASLTSAQFSYSDTTVSVRTPNNPYYYYVLAKNNNGVSGMSNIVDEYPSSAPGSPSLIITSSSFISLHIAAPSNNGAIITSYEVYRAEVGFIDPYSGAFAQNLASIVDGHPIGEYYDLATIDLSGNVSFTDNSVTIGQAYLYEVKAVNRDGAGDWSTTDSISGEYVIPTTNFVVPSTRPDPITSLYTRSPYNNSLEQPSVIDVIWTPPNNNGAPITKYRLDISNNGGTSWKQYTNAFDDDVPTNISVLDGSSNIIFTDGDGWFINDGRLITDTLTFGTLYNMDGSGYIQGPAPDASGNIRMRVNVMPTGNNMYNDASGNYFVMGSEYLFRLYSYNDVGLSHISNSPTVVCSRQPQPPTNITSQAADKSVTLTWEAPTNNGGSDILSYFIYDSSDNKLASVQSQTLTYTVTRDFSGNLLVNNTSYTFKVSSLNKNGFSNLVSAQAVTPRAIPARPSDLTYTGLDVSGNVIVQWGSPENVLELSDPFTYEYELLSGQSTVISTTSVSSTVSTVTLTGLTNGTQYTFIIRAISNGVTGIETSTSLTPSTNPTVVNPLQISRTGAQIRLFWSPPVNDGGSAIISYLIVWYDNNDLMRYITVLEDAREYIFTNPVVVHAVIFAINKNGPSPMSNIVVA